jgi:hypothetical protein
MAQIAEHLETKAVLYPEDDLLFLQSLFTKLESVETIAITTEDQRRVTDIYNRVTFPDLNR